MKTTLIVLPLLVLGGCGSPGLRACDDAIKNTLKTPASYKRVSANGSDGDWKIGYDAVNEFNAPLRANGRCFVDANGARWREDRPPDLIY